MKSRDGGAGSDLDNPQASIAQRHTEMLARWRAHLSTHAPQQMAALSNAEFEELASLLEESYQEALNESQLQGGDSALEITARERALDRLGSWDELLGKLNRRTVGEHKRVQELLVESAGRPVGNEVDATPRLRGATTNGSSVRTHSYPGRSASAMVGQGMHQLRLATRSVLRARSVAATSVFLLGLGLGAAITLFSVFQTVVLNELPYADVTRLGVVRIDALGRQGMPRISASNVIDFREGATTITELHLIFTPKLSIGGATDDNFDLVRVASIDAELPVSLGIRPAIGRLFDSARDVAHEGLGNVLLSHELWVSRYAADPEIVGRTITLSQRDVEVIGVLEPKQTLVLGPNQDREISLWTARSAVRERGTILRYTAYVRLADGASFEEAGAELQALADRGRQIDQEEGERPIFHVTPIMQHLTEDSRGSLSLLLMAAIFVLLLACVNVAGLLAARALFRAQEWAVRAALGASRARLLFNGLAEGLVLALFSGLLGLGLAHVLLQAIATSTTLELPRIENVGIDRSVLLFAMTTTALTALLIGLLPAWRASRSAFRGVARSRAGIAGPLAGGTPLVVAQVALALLLLAGTGVLMRTYFELQQVELGYNADHLLTFDFSLSRELARSGSARMELNREVIRRLEELPEVESASLTNQLPLSGQNLASYAVDPATRQNFGALTGSFHRVFPNYFRTMGIQLHEGRSFTETDMKTPNSSVVVSRNLADSAWPGESAIGEYITIEFATPDGGTEPRDSRVIGVVNEVREVDLHSDQSPQAYLAYGENSWAQDFVVKTHGPTHDLMPKIDRILKSLGPGLVVDDAETFTTRVRSSTREHRQVLNLTAAFSILALLIASLGIYAAMAHRVATRTREIGLRMAMGAQRNDLVTWVLHRGVAVTLVGIVLGISGSLGLLRLLESFVFGVSSRDPLTLVLVASVLLLAALAACWFPARRASLVDPVVALGSE